MFTSEKIFNNVYADGLAELVIYYAGIENIEEKIVTMPSIRSVIMGFYWELLKRKELVPIQDLGQEEKEKYWNLAPREMKFNERKDIARAIYLIQKIKG